MYNLYKLYKHSWPNQPINILREFRDISDNQVRIVSLLVIS